MKRTCHGHHVCEPAKLCCPQLSVLYDISIGDGSTICAGNCFCARLYIRDKATALSVDMNIDSSDLLLLMLEIVYCK
jgi:hypothetical protein